MSGAAARVMFVIPGTGEGSSMIFARRQAQALRAQGAEIAEFFLRSRTSAARLTGEMRRFVARNCRAFRPGVVHAHYGTVTALFTAIGMGLFATRTPLVITYRGSDLNPCPGWSRIRTAAAHLFSQVAALRAARIVCVSAHLRERLWWRRGHVTVLASGVDARVFEPGERGEARRRLGWDERPCCSTGGRIRRSSGWIWPKPRSWRRAGRRRICDGRFWTDRPRRRWCRC